MYKEVLRSIDGVEIFPIISLIIFFSFFVITCIVWYRKDKKTVDEYANIPLNDSEELSNHLNVGSKP